MKSRLLLALTFSAIAPDVNSQATTFVFTGVVQTYTVPACVNTLTVDVKGAEGAASTAAAASLGGKGGRVQANISVTPGEVLNIYVGQKPTGPAAGFNGGGAATTAAGGGGGASDIRQGGTAFANRIIVAGGGGGGGYYTTSTLYIGGHAGGLSGTGGYSGTFGGGGGTQTGGGAGGISTGGNGSPGGLGIGGNGNAADGGAGGGGYYGGGGGSYSGTIHYAGGGGSSYATTSAINVTHTSAFQFGNGSIVITPIIGPGQPGTISGPAILCSGTTATYSIAPVPTATSYTWTVPAGSTFTGSGTSISVTVGNTSGNISVTANNACGTSTPSVLSITVSQTPTFTGLAASYCVNDPPAVLTPSTTGGSFSGPGISNDTFSPAAAGPGTHTITYATIGTGNYTLSQTGTYNPIAGVITPVTLSDDQVSTVQPIGFTFNFYGTNYTNFYISSNGFITFNPGSGNGCCLGEFIPNNDPSLSNMIAGCWQDLLPPSGGTLGYFTTGSAPNRKLVVEYNAIPYFGGGGSPVTFQIILFESSGIIEIHTGSVSGDGDDQTMGIQNPGGTLATPVAGRNAVDWSATNDFVRFIPPIGCTTTQSVVVNPLPAVPVITANGSTTFCQGDDVQLTSSSAASYLWSDGATTQSITVSTAGIYSVTVTDANGCSETSAPETVTVNPLPAPVINSGGPTTFCQGDSVQLTSSVASGYLWSTSETTQSIYANASGNYDVTVTDANGCAGTSAPITITVNPLPVVSFSNLSGNYCLSNSPVTLTGTPAGGTFSGPGISGNTFDPAAAGLGTHVITYVYTDGNSCTGSHAQMTEVANNAFVTLGPDTIVCIYSPSFILMPGLFSTYQWHDNSTADTYTVDPLLLGVGVHTLYVNVTNAAGCTGVDSVVVEVSDCVGMTEVESMFVNVSPNPTEGIVNIIVNNFEGNELTFRITNITGQLIKEQEISSSPGYYSGQIDLSGLAKGIYYLQINDREKFSVHKIVLQ